MITIGWVTIQILTMSAVEEPNVSPAHESQFFILPATHLIWAMATRPTRLCFYVDKKSECIEIIHIFAIFKINLD